MNQLHPNYRKAYYLSLINLILTLLSPFFTDIKLPIGAIITMVIVGLLITLPFIYFIQKGSPTVKYYFLAITILGVWLGLTSTKFNSVNAPMLILLNIISTIVSFWIIVLLFKIPKNYKLQKVPENNTESLDTLE